MIFRDRVLKSTTTTTTTKPIVTSPTATNTNHSKVGATFTSLLANNNHITTTHNNTHYYIIFTIIHDPDTLELLRRRTAITRTAITDPNHSCLAHPLDCLGVTNLCTFAISTPSIHHQHN